VDFLTSAGFRDMMTPERLFEVLRAIIVLIVGFVLARLASAGAGRVAIARFDRQGALIVRRIVFWGILALAVASMLHELGFHLSVLLGAAGILTVAVGFASQTSASNLISGLFLIAERPFVVGDVIQVEDVTGEVLSIDLLSVKLRTFDNLLVRIPNEFLIKTRFTTLTHFPIRRMDLQIGVAYKEDLARVRKILLGLTDRNPDCLEEPEPLFIFKGFGASSLDIQFSVWARREGWFRTKLKLLEDIKVEFDRQGIEIPFPHVSVYAGSVTAPMPVTVVQPEDPTARGPEVGSPS